MVMGSMYSAPDIYHRIRGGRGSTGFSNNGTITGEQSDLQGSMSDQIKQLNVKMNQAWQGAASQQAISGAGPLQTSAEQTSAKLATASAAMDSQVSAFHTAYNSVVPMNSSPPSNNIVNEMVSGLGINTPLDQQISSYNAAGQHNVQVYNTYSSESAANAAQMPTSFDELPNPHPTIQVVSPTSGSVGGPSFTGSSGPTSGGYTGTSGYQPPSGPGNYGAPAPYGSTGPSGYNPTPPPPGGGGWTPPPAGGQDPVLTPSSFDPGPGGPGGGMDPFPGMGFGGPNGPGGDQFVGPGGYPGGRGGFSGEDEVSGPGGFSAGGYGGAGGFGGTGGESFGSSGPGATSGTSSASANASAAMAGEETVMGVPSGGPGGAPMVAGGRGRKGEDDKEHKTAEYLQEADPDALFGYDQQTVPPVIE